jgi:hypothetical protein
MSVRHDSPARMDARALARARRDALRARTRRIRHAVAGVAATLFVLVFAVVYVQLASGHDPALVANARKHATAVHSESSAATKGSSTATGSAGTIEATGTAESTGATEAADATEATESSSGEESSASAVTTSQS